MQDKIIGIVGGNGAMGKCFQEFFEKNGFTVLISDINTKLSNQQLAEKSDIVIISVPINKTVEIIQEVAPHMKKDALLMDLTSIKSEPVKAMEENFKGAVLGCHPLFGPTNFNRGQIIVLCPARGESFMQDLFEKSGMKVEIMSAGEHDKIMAMVQGLSHFNSIAFVHAISKCDVPLEKYLSLQSPSYRITLDFFARILNQSPELYGSIQIANPLNVQKIRDFLTSSEELLKIVEKKDLKAFMDYFNKCKNYLGDFTQKAQEESDAIIDSLAKKDDFFVEQNASSADLAILGPENTYSDMASGKYFSEKKKYFCRTINEVFQMVENDEISEGFVPIENNIEGSVSMTLDNLFWGKAHIAGLYEFSIHHAFLAKKGAKEGNITKVYSHTQALGQCQDFLRKKFPKAVQISVSSTAEAVNIVSSENEAAIASKQAGEKAGLIPLYEKIKDISNNKTSFVLIKKGEIEWENKKILSLAFMTKNKAGALLRVLNSFAKNGVNLCKIESHPNKKKMGEFIFFVNAEINQDIKKALEEVRENADLVKILGAW